MEVRSTDTYLLPVIISVAKMVPSLPTEYTVLPSSDKAIEVTASLQAASLSAYEGLNNEVGLNAIQETMSGAAEL